MTLNLMPIAKKYNWSLRFENREIIYRPSIPCNTYFIKQYSISNFSV